MVAWGQPGCRKEGMEQLAFVSQVSDGDVEFLVKLFQIPTYQISHFHVLEISPDPLHGVEVRRVRRQQFEMDPFLGTLFVFRNRSGTAIKLLVYDGSGFWLCQKRFSKGRLQWWPRGATGVESLPAEQLAVLIYNGLPLQARMVEPWRRVS